MKIVFKLDDLKEENYNKFDRVCSIAKNYNIHVTIGIINSSIHNTNKQYINWIIEKNKNKYIIFWNHGLYHEIDVKTGYSEYNRNYETQEKNILESHNYSKEKLGFEYDIFGAPYNISNEHTINILEKLDYKYMFFPFKNSKSNKVMLLKNRIDMELETGITNYDFFVESFDANKHYDYGIVQGHPNIWEEDSFIEFEKIVIFLLEKKCEITKPSLIYEN